jgi:hypothetical protein
MLIILIEESLGHRMRFIKFRAGRHGVPLSMSRIHPECLDPVPSDRSVAADVRLRQEPNEDEDEEEDEGDGKDDSDEDYQDDDGYSE